MEQIVKVIVTALPEAPIPLVDPAITTRIQMDLITTQMTMALRTIMLVALELDLLHIQRPVVVVVVVAKNRSRELRHH